MVKHSREYKFAAEVADGVENDVLTVAVTTHWDPVETAATRPLAFVDHSGDVPVTYFYTHDLTKNICEVLDASGAIVTAYDYTPFGAVTASNSATPTNTVTFSSEVLDAETALVYYNYRHYNPADGRWINRDPIDEQGGMNLYAMVGNGMLWTSDFLGNACGSGWSDVLIADNPCGYDFTRCCEQHDECYDDCKTSKRNCDQRFGECVREVCAKRYGAKFGCFLIAMLYTGAVVSYGNKAFKAARKRCNKSGVKK